MMEKPLILVRHAQAEHHTENLTGGWTDSHLTGEGQRQARLVARRLQNELPEAEYLLACSDLARAIQTAAPLSAALRCEPQIFSELRDLNNGQAANLTREEAHAIAIPPSDPLMDWTPYPEAESWRQFHARVTAFLNSFAERLENGPESAAILISHASTINIITIWWLGLAPETNVFFRTGPASLTVLLVSRWGERVVERLNDTAHLYTDGKHDSIRLGK